MTTFICMPFGSALTECITEAGLSSGDLTKAIRHNIVTSIIIGASLSEPHIDGDVRPSPRGMFVCIWPCGAFVLPMFPRSHVRVNIDRAP